jgi:nucleoside-diphosphate-sugar epimerase
MLKVVVTGAGGFVGSRVCQLLIKKKIKVIATYNSNKINIKNITYKRFNIYKKKK